MSTPTATILDSFMSATRSVGTAATLAFAGIYLHRTQRIPKESTKLLASIAQQVTIPALLWTKFISCSPITHEHDEYSFATDHSENTCPDLFHILHQSVWIIFLWPCYVVFCGFMVGSFVSYFFNVPHSQRSTIRISCAFGNSTGLPLTLLSTLRSYSSSSLLPIISTHRMNTTSRGNDGSGDLLPTDVRRLLTSTHKQPEMNIDPTLLLSVYLLLYPMLQWGLGGWLLASSHAKNLHELSSAYPSSIPYVHSIESNDITSLEGTNKKEDEDSSEEQDIVSELVSISSAPTIPFDHTSNTMLLSSSPFATTNHRMVHSTPKGSLRQISWDDSFPSLPEESQLKTLNRSYAYGTQDESFTYSNHDEIGGLKTISRMEQISFLSIVRSCITRGKQSYETLKDILQHSFQPPVIGSILGMLMSSIRPLRGLFVCLEENDTSKPAVFGWFFDGLCTIGQAAVPINMILLGINISMTYSNPSHGTNPISKLTRTTATQSSIGSSGSSGSSSIEIVSKQVISTSRTDEFTSKILSCQTIAGVVIGKMVVMPIIGILSTFVLHASLGSFVSADLSSSLYLVLMIVFITPTANNVIVLAELEGGPAKEILARLIGWQYVFAPLCLSLSVAVLVHLTSSW